MNAVLFLALKDVMKDKRTLLMILFVIAIGVTASIVMSGLFKGFSDYFNGVTIDLMTGHVAISPAEGREYVTNVGNIEKKIQLLPEVRGVSPRLVASGIALRKGRESQVRVTGLTPSKEMQATKLAERVSDGEFLGDNDKNALLGSALASNLNVRTGERFSVTFRNGVVREYKVKGLVDTGARSGDEVAVFLANKELESVLGIQDSASLIIIKLTDTGLAEKAKLDIMQLGIRGEIKTWKELASYVEQISKNFGFVFNLITFISLTAAAISVAVVMFINVEHRTREIGILKAIGARNYFVMRVFLTEILVYAFLGVLLGNLMGYGLSAYLKAFPAVSFLGSGGTASIAIVPVLAFGDMLSASAMVFLVTLLAGLYPVLMAMRMDIIKAIWGG